ncbi:hypothetical protein GXM_01712 [Nostoc sphaeroides CCNUC1]|uniref:Uncharacterized protein n=1 Tax=Nostoc sphaeroides CCNUC1 TaxID=2653204 RepID=A0A5P8VWH9_9NOSO|nr:hypothetical protein GXM_01712 [Nostoc sphaeroides CCNUC1]
MTWQDLGLKPQVLKFSGVSFGNLGNLHRLHYPPGIEIPV